MCSFHRWCTGWEHWEGLGSLHICQGHGVKERVWHHWWALWVEQWCYLEQEWLQVVQGTRRDLTMLPFAIISCILSVFAYSPPHTNTYTHTCTYKVINTHKHVHTCMHLHSLSLSLSLSLHTHLYTQWPWSVWYGSALPSCIPCGTLHVCRWHGTGFHSNSPILSGQC